MTVIATTSTQETRSLRTFIEAFFRNSKLFRTVIAVVLCAAVLYILFAKKQYESETKLLIQNARSTSVLTADHSTGDRSSTTGTDVSEQQINSELELLMSQDVLTTVADPEWTRLSPVQRTPDRTREHEVKIVKLSKSFAVQSGRKSSLIAITSTADSPREAADRVRALTSAYLAQRKVLSRPGGTTQFFEEEAARARAEWDKANQALVDFQQKHHLVSIPETEMSLNEDLTNSEEKLREAMTARAESDQKLHEAILALARVPERQPTQQRSLENQSAEQQMRTLLLTLGNKRTELLTRYPPTDRLVVEVDQQIRDTQASLRDVTSGRGHEETTDVNPVWQQLKTNISLEQVNHSAIEGRIKSLQDRISGLQGNLGSTQDVATEYNQLKSRADQTESNYKLFVEKHDEATVEDAMDAHQLVNVSIAESPTMSYKPASPRPLRLMLLSFVTAILLGVASVAVLEFTRSTVSNARELEGASTFPVLASLPLQFASHGSSSGAGLPEAQREHESEAFTETATLIPVLQHLRTATERR